MNFETDLINAINDDDIDKVKLIIEKSTRDLDYNKIMYKSAQGGNINIVKLMIEKGANDWNMGMSGAAEGGYKDLVEFFIEKGANDWNDAIDGAIYNLKVDIVELFLKKYDIYIFIEDYINYLDDYNNDERLIYTNDWSLASNIISLLELLDNDPYYYKKQNILQLMLSVNRKGYNFIPPEIYLDIMHKFM